ncbi:polysaccharide biosynthesis C-terminal domain-containing protein [Cystobacter fuscus]
MGGLVASGLLALWLDGTPLLVAWAGPVASERLTSVTLAILGFAAVIQASQEASAATLTLSNDSARRAAHPILIGHMFNVTISLIGVRYFGAWAVAGGTACGNLLMAVLIWGRSRALMQWRLSQVLQTIAPILGAVLVAGAAGWGWLRSPPSIPWRARPCAAWSPFWAPGRPCSSGGAGTPPAPPLRRPPSPRSCPPSSEGRRAPAAHCRSSTTFCPTLASRLPLRSRCSPSRCPCRWAQW